MNMLSFRTLRARGHAASHAMVVKQLNARSPNEPRVTMFSSTDAWAAVTWLANIESESPVNPKRFSVNEIRFRSRVASTTAPLNPVKSTVPMGCLAASGNDPVTKHCAFTELLLDVDGVFLRQCGVLRHRKRSRSRFQGYLSYSLAPCPPSSLERR